MDAFKSYFKKKNLDRKFKKAGEGHALSEESQPKASLPVKTESRMQPTSEATRAGEAAIARLDNLNRKADGKHRQPSSMIDPFTACSDSKRESLSSVSQKIETNEIGTAAASAHIESSDRNQPSVELQRVMLICPFCGSSKTNNGIQDCLRSCLNKWYEIDPIEASAAQIQVLNRKEAIDVCITTISKYINNIISDPEVEKYRKIRVNNKTFQEKVANVEGSIPYLLALRFTLQRLPFQDGEEDFYYLARESIDDVDLLKAALVILTSAEGKKPTLDKDMRVYKAASAAPRVELPAEFYRVLAAEVKQEQAQKSKAIALESELRTKAMRKRDEGKVSRYYLYTIIRVKFPDDVLIQGTFHSNDTLATVFEFISSCLCNDAIVYTLSTSLGKKLDNYQSVLSELDLVPSCILHVSWDVAIMAELQSLGILDANQKFYYLKSGVKFLIQELQ